MDKSQSQSADKAASDSNIDPRLSELSAPIASGGSSRVIWPTGLIGRADSNVPSRNEGSSKGPVEGNTNCKAKKAVPPTPKPHVYTTKEVIADPLLRALSRYYTGTPSPAVWKLGTGFLGHNGTYLYPPPPK